MKNPSDISQSSISTGKPKKTVSFSYNSQLMLKIAGVLVIAIVAFLLGLTVGDHHSNKAASVANQAFAGGSGGFRRAGGGFGSVSAVSSTSITVNDARTNTSKTYSITSSTKISDNGQSIAASSITTGERVIVIPNSSNASQAATIIVNPSFGGGGFGGAAPSSGSSTGSSTSTTPSGSSTGSSTTIQ